MTKRRASATERVLPSGQVTDPGPGLETGRPITPAPDDPPTDAAALSDDELDARIAADVVDADAEIAAADAAGAEGAGEIAASFAPATHVRLYLKDLKAKNGALVRAATAIHHPHVGSFPRMLTVSLAPGVSTMFERAGQDADGFEVYRQPDF